jgi:hypothetical protein
MEADLSFREYRRLIENELGTENWVTVYSTQEGINFYCALIPGAMRDKVLSNVSWDFTIGSGLPGRESDGDSTEPKYLRFGRDDGIEPLIVHRDYSGMRPSQKEVSEEFRHYFRLYHDTVKNKYIKFDDDGNEDEVIIVGSDGIRIKLKYLKEYLAVRNMQLAVYFELRRFSEQTLHELGIDETRDTVSNENYTYALSILDSDFASDGHRSFSLMCGKKLINGAKDVKPERGEDKFVDFIIGIDGDGKDVVHTCDKEKLSNYFGANPGSSHYLTPVFFRKDVLSKYYVEPARYSVEDGLIRCGGLWNLSIDNNHDKYIMVYLGDLGDLSYEHQLHWRHHNIASDGTGSVTNFKRALMGEFANPVRADLIFKQIFPLFQKKWKENFGWELFIPLKPGDEHHFKALRIPLTNDQQEFDGQVGSLVKIIIDSLNEKQLAKGLDIKKPSPKGLDKFEAFLDSKHVPEDTTHQVVEYLRKLQKLRSGGVAHRKGVEYDKTAKEFSIPERSFPDVFEDILNQVIRTLNALEECLLQKPGPDLAECGEGGPRKPQ